MGWVNYLKGFLCSFCCPSASPAEGSVHAGPVWLPLGGDSSGCSCPTKEVWGGQGQTNGTGGFGFPESLLHIWPHLVAPSAAAGRGHSVTLVTNGAGLCALTGGDAGAMALFLQCCCRQEEAVGSPQLCRGCLLILTSSSPPWAAGRGDCHTRFRICFLTGDSSCSP